MLTPLEKQEYKRMNTNLEVFTARLASLMKEHNVCLWHNPYVGFGISDINSNAEIIIDECDNAVGVEEILKALDKVKPNE